MSRPIPGDQLIPWLEKWRAPIAIAADAEPLPLVDASYAK
jgi:hypothetical protein